MKILQPSDVYLSHPNKYPVIKLTLKDVEATHFMRAKKKMATKISNEYDRHAYLLKSPKLRNKEKDTFEKILDKEMPLEDYQEILEFLSTSLEKYYDKKVIIDFFSGLDNL